MNNARDQLIVGVAEELQQPEDLVATVIAWSFKDAAKALRVHNEVEISGLGKFIISQAKLKKRIKKLERILGRLNDPTLEVKRREDKIRFTTETLAYYYSKLKNPINEEETNKANMGGVAQFDIPPRGTERTD